MAELLYLEKLAHLQLGMCLNQSIGVKAILLGIMVNF